MGYLEATATERATAKAGTTAIKGESIDTGKSKGEGKTIDTGKSNGEGKSIDTGKSNGEGEIDGERFTSPPFRDEAAKGWGTRAVGGATRGLLALHPT